MKKRFLIFTILILLSVSLFASEVDTSYEIDQYDCWIDINENGSLSFKGEIKAYFRDLSKHGIYVYVPTLYENRLADITNLKCNSHDYKRLSEKGFEILRIGSPNVTVNEEEVYSYGYDYDSHKDSHSDYDEFYFNILGNNVNTSVFEYNCLVTFPKPINRDMIFLTSGERGSEGNNVNAYLEFSDDYRQVFIFADEVKPFNSITLRVELPEGYFVNPTEAEPLIDYYVLKVFMYTFAFIIIILALLWVLFGRDKDIVYSPEFYPPKDLNPMDVGFIIDGSLDDHDKTSMIYYWADKGFCEIEEIEDGYVISKTKDLPSDAPKNEKELFELFFNKIGDEGVLDTTNINISDEEQALDATKKMNALSESTRLKFKGKGKKFYNTVSEFFKAISKIGIIVISTIFYSYLASPVNEIGTAKGRATVGFFINIFIVISIIFSAAIFEKNKLINFKKAFIKFLISFGIFMAIDIVLFRLFLASTINQVGSYNSLRVYLVFYVIFLFASSILSTSIRKKSDYYNSLLASILGFRDFIEKVEINQLKMLIDEDPDYYYKTLSYAIVLGLEKKWAKKFENLLDVQPSWYHGSTAAPLVTAAAFNTIGRSIGNSIDSAIASSMPSSSGSTGGSFSGSGGFSGGGGGGGGVGSW